MSEVRCALCRHPKDLTNCGLGEVADGNGFLWLCHTSSHDCYTNWTVYGARPAARGGEEE